jgi:hypothetical protein
LTLNVTISKPKKKTLKAPEWGGSINIIKKWYVENDFQAVQNIKPTSNKII